MSASVLKDPFLTLAIIMMLKFMRKIAAIYDENLPFESGQGYPASAI